MIEDTSMETVPENPAGEAMASAAEPVVETTTQTQAEEPATETAAQPETAESVPSNTVQTDGSATEVIAQACESATETCTQPAKMEIDAPPPSTPAAKANGIMGTPSRSLANGDTGMLSDIIAGATPSRRSESQFKCVYPPSEDTQSLIVEHFGFLPISFIDEIINAANDTIYRATDALCKFVEKEQGSGEATNQAINKAETLLEHAVDKNFDKFELYALRNLFNVPQGLEDYIVLPHRSPDATGGPAVYAEDEAELDKELEQVRRQLVAENLLKARLQCDITKVEKAVRRLRALNENLHFDEISQRLLKEPAAAVVANVRAQIAEVSQLVEQLEAVADPKHEPLSMEALKEPSGRDLYLAHMADMQITAWEDSRQAQTQAN
ncbi:hypothetical protein IWW36_000365 [Coemansia brasiliensis]|uniref:Mis12-domain-containing protein n=1 Tax=Coemansia brasiliensis TaxID=2650707 RepID=A0A9W8IIN1_9FUNG|nr:hypothetical protein IWW36_000365 [Coemansia brasiliensis]